jgi:hypothetical protein
MPKVRVGGYCTPAGPVTTTAHLSVFFLSIRNFVCGHKTWESDITFNTSKEKHREKHKEREKEREKEDEEQGGVDVKKN